ncbi:MAG: hypothetical protein R3B41_02045 [Candidatus Doudnabacteria bacterium]
MNIQFLNTAYYLEVFQDMEKYGSRAYYEHFKGQNYELPITVIEALAEKNNSDEHK